MSADDDSQPGESEAKGEPESDAQVSDRVDAVWEYVELLEESIGELRAETDALRDELQAEQEARKELERRHDDRIQGVEDRTDMLQLVEQADQADAKQRSTALFQHLKRKAQSRQRDGRDPIAMLDHDAAEEALHYPDVDRTTIYSDMERVVRWVGDEDVCWYTGGELWLDLSGVRGGAPQIPAGSDICGASTTAQTGVTPDETGSEPGERNQT